MHYDDWHIKALHQHLRLAGWPAPHTTLRQLVPTSQLGDLAAAVSPCVAFAACPHMNTSALSSYPAGLKASGYPAGLKASRYSTGLKQLSSWTESKRLFNWTEAAIQLDWKQAATQLDWSSYPAGWKQLRSLSCDCRAHKQGKPVRHPPRLCHRRRQHYPVLRSSRQARVWAEIESEYGHVHHLVFIRLWDLRSDSLMRCDCMLWHVRRPLLV